MQFAHRFNIMVPYTASYTEPTVPRDSDSPAVSPNFAIWGDSKKNFERRPVPPNPGPSLRHWFNKLSKKLADYFNLSPKRGNDVTHD